MKIYRVKASYNNGDYNEWENWEDVTSKWYTSKKEAEKHIEELTAFLNWLRYLYHEKDHFKAVNPTIEEAEVYESFSPMEEIQPMWTNRTFKLSEFKYIEEMPSLNIESITFCSSLDTFISSWNYGVKIGEELFEVSFSEYHKAEDWDIRPSTDESNKDSKYWLYSPSIQKKIVEVIREKVVIPLLPIFEKAKHSWDERYACDEDSEEYKSLWYVCRLKELKYATEGIGTVDAFVSYYSIETLNRRREHILSKFESFGSIEEGLKEELEYINSILESLK